jgi:hypothetical protein
MDKGMKMIAGIVVTSFILSIINWFAFIEINKKYLKQFEILQEGINKNNTLISKFDFNIKQNKDSIFFFDKKVIQLNQKIIEREKQLNNIQNSDSIYVEFKNILDSLRRK